MMMMKMIRGIFMEDHIPWRPDSSLLLCRYTDFYMVLRDVVFHENTSCPLSSFLNYDFMIYAWNIY